jgi:hypothetical protein
MFAVALIAVKRSARLVSRPPHFPAGLDVEVDEPDAGVASGRDGGLGIRGHR